MSRPVAERIGVWLLAITFCIGVQLTGCRKQSSQGPFAPQLRGPVKDLVAIRAGNEISLSWTVPKNGTGKLVVNGLIKVQVCRRESTTNACNEAGEPLLLARGAIGSFSEKLPVALASGTPRLLYYFVELMDRNGGSTGVSNSVVTLAGAPPPPVQGLMAEMTTNGILLHWKPDTTVNDEEGLEVRLQRWEVAQVPATEAMREGLTAFPSIPEKDVSVKDGTGQALDQDIRNGKTYSYTAMRVFRTTVGGQTVELDGQLSRPVEINTVSKP